MSRNLCRCAAGFICPRRARFWRVKLSMWEKAANVFVGQWKRIGVTQSSRCDRCIFLGGRADVIELKFGHRSFPLVGSLCVS